MQNQILSCQCGKVQLSLKGKEIASADCGCSSCQKAAAKMQTLDGAPTVLNSHGATHFELYRKDYINCEKGAENLAQFCLKEDSPTRRIIATCCNTPMFLDFGPGHWASVYGILWPFGTVASKHAKSFSAGFMAKLLWAWVKMGFKTPKITFVDRKIEL